MSPEEVDALASAPAAYVHIPFCSAVCPYCDFAVVAGQDDLARRYVDAVVAEISASKPWRPLDSVFFGGGTPSHIDPALLGEILDALSHRHGIAPGAEVTLEANPEDFVIERAMVLVDLGFNRVSFGAQSFDPSVLASLGRRHGPAQIEVAVTAARDARFGSVSVDLIYGTPGESDESWASTLEQAVAIKTDHVSCYALTVEAGTPLGRQVRAGATPPNPDVQADRHAVAAQVLGAAGLDRYEVSNWARPGHECRYNMTVWAQGEYLAFGNGAHGFREGRRFRNHRRVDAYIDRIASDRTARAGVDDIEGWDAELDRVFVGLRRTAGVVHGPGTRALLESSEGRRLLDVGAISADDRRVYVSRPLLTDAVLRAVLAQPAPIVRVDGDA
jgi:putative oxygen-independent coproporphyrinogen III oxidase